jgi:peptidoglycan/LPS O-acetylase OafA/YrhL
VFYQIAVSAALHRPFRVGEWSTFWLNVLNIHAWGFLDRFDWNFPSWSISAEMAAYITFPIICVGLMKKKSAVIAALVLILGAYIAYLLVGGDSRDGWERKALITCLPMFFLGVLVYQVRDIALRVTADVLFRCSGYSKSFGQNSWPFRWD